jgi:hypothetical protein
MRAGKSLENRRIAMGFLTDICQAGVGWQLPFSRFPLTPMTMMSLIFTSGSRRKLYVIPQ